MTGSDRAAGRPGALTDRRVAIAAAVAGVTVWWLAHPFVGTGVDGTVYTLMALNRLHPGVFGADLFLAYGSQDAFSLFSPLYAAVISWLGLPAANMALLAAAYALWLAGAWLLCHRLLRGLAAHGAFLLMCALQPLYGAWSVLYAGENLLTPRPIAEALVMIGLAALLGRAWIRSAAAFVLAAAFHPAMAVAGPAAGLLILAARRRLLWWAIPLAVAAILALALAHVAPFDRLLVIMDPAWLAAVRERDDFVFLAAWRPVDWARLAAGLAPCLAAGLWSGGQRRRAFWAVAATAVAGLAVSAVGGDLLHDALIIQLQPWRAAWLLAVVALPALALLWLRLRRRPLGLLARLLLTAPLLVLTPPFEQVVWAPALLMSLAGLVLAARIRRGRAPRLSATVGRLMCEVVLVLPAANFIDGFYYLWTNAAFAARFQIPLADETGFAPVRWGLLAGAAAAALLASRRPGRVAAVLCAALVAGAVLWDQRTPWDRFVLDGRQLPLAASLPAHAQVLWGPDAAPVWFQLGRPAYVSASQANGLLFSRATAAAWISRRNAVWPLLPLGTWKAGGKPVACAYFDQPMRAEVVRTVCARAPGLTGVIVDRPAPGLKAASFTTPAAVASICQAGPRLATHLTRRFYYIACAGQTRR